MPPSGGVCRVLLREAWTNELRKRQTIQPINFAKNAQKKKDPKLLTPSLTRHMQIKDLPQGFASRLIQDKRRLRIHSSSDLDLEKDYTLPRTASPRQDPIQLLSPLHLLGLHPSPSIVARARDGAAASVFSPSSSLRRKNVFHSEDKVERQETCKKEKKFISSFYPQKHQEEEEACQRTSLSKSKTECDFSSSSFSSFFSPDLYVELSRMASERERELLGKDFAALVPSLLHRSQNASATSSSLVREALRKKVLDEEKKRKKFKDTKTLKRILPESVRWKEDKETNENGSTYRGRRIREGWKDDRDTVREVYRHHVSIERGQSMSPFAFSVDP